MNVLLTSKTVDGQVVGLMEDERGFYVRSCREVKMVEEGAEYYSVLKPVRRLFTPEEYERGCMIRYLRGIKVFHDIIAQHALTAGVIGICLFEEITDGPEE